MSFDTAARGGHAYIAAPATTPCSVTALNQQFLYVSHLAPRVRYDVFSAVCHVSRRRNAELSLAGVLLFDGHRFCQWLEGPPDALAPVRESIVRDPRHEFMSVLVDRPKPLAGARELWQAGYCGPDELDLLLGPDRMQDDETMAIFRSIVTRSDLSP
jgi:Sensors of blue-light using FAD